MLFDLIEEAKKILAIDTSGLTGTRPLAESLVPFCRRLGFTVSLQGPKTGSPDANLIAHTASPDGGDLCPDGLAFVTHLDTVPAGDPELWTETGGNPLQPVLSGDRLYGLGSADTKLDILCKLLAIDRVGLANLKIPLALVGSFGEERSLAGARLIRETGLMRPKFALIGEPSELKAVVAHKGILYMRARFQGDAAEVRDPTVKKTFRGRAAHGSMPHLGENAIEKAMRWAFEQKESELVDIHGGTVHNVVPELCRIGLMPYSSHGPRLRFLKAFLGLMDKAREMLQKEHNPAFDPPHSTDNIGVVRMPDLNTIEIDFDFRLIPETVIQSLEEIFAALPKEAPGGVVETIRSNPPLNTLPDTEIVRYVGQAQTGAGLTQAFVVKSGNTEAPIFREMGAQAVVIGPGRSVGNIHAPNEHVEVPQLFKAVDFYTAFLRQFC